MIKFSIFTILSGFLETGPLIYCLLNGDVLLALVSVLFYQLGNLVPVPVSLSRKQAIGLGSLSCILFFTSTYITWLLVPATLASSAALQSVRNNNKGIAKKIVKRSLRMSGFILGFLFTPILGSLGSIVIAWGLAKGVVQRAGISKLHFGKLQFVMLFHQIHYFVYCYAVLITAFQVGGSITAILIFSLGWLTYIFGAKLYRSTNYVVSFIIGHSTLIVLLVVMFFVEPMSIRALLWVATGLCGTTEFCIGKLEHKTNSYSEIQHNAAENIGHVIGVSLCILIYIASGSLDLLPLVAAGSAMLALATLILVPGKTKGADYENQHC